MEKKKRTAKKFQVIRNDTYKFYVLAKDKEDLQRKLNANPDLSECGEFVESKFVKFTEMKQ